MRPHVGHHRSRPLLTDCPAPPGAVTRPRAGRRWGGPWWASRRRVAAASCGSRATRRSNRRASRIGESMRSKGPRWRIAVVGDEGNEHVSVVLPLAVPPLTGYCGGCARSTRAAVRSAAAEKDGVPKRRTMATATRRPTGRRGWPRETCGPRPGAAIAAARRCPQRAALSRSRLEPQPRGGVTRRAVAQRRSRASGLTRPLAEAIRGFGLEFCCRFGSPVPPRYGVSSFVFSFLPIRKVLVLSFAGAFSPPLGWFLFCFQRVIDRIVGLTTCSLLLVWVGVLTVENCCKSHKPVESKRCKALWPLRGSRDTGESNPARKGF